MALGWGKWQEGVVVGVSAGAILSLGTATVEAIDNYLERREQVRYLAHLIDDYRSRIYGAADFKFRQQSATRDQMRKLYYDDMRQRIRSVLRERSSRLSYDEVEEVRDVFALYDSGFVPAPIYDSIFEGLDSIEWLGLR